jgi:hypothetical protein
MSKIKVTCPCCAKQNTHVAAFETIRYKESGQETRLIYCECLDCEHVIGFQAEVSVEQFNKLDLSPAA